MLWFFSESYSVAIAKLCASLAKVDPEAISPIADTYLLGDMPSTQLSSITIREIIESAPQAFYDLGLEAQVVARVLKHCEPMNSPSVARPAREARELLKEVSPWAEDEDIQSKL